MAALGRVAADIAHELNNPLSVVIGNLPPLTAQAELVASVAAASGDERLHDAARRLLRLIEVVARGAERSATVVRDLRAFAHGSTATAGPVELHQCVELALRLLRSRWDNRIVVERCYTATAPALGVQGQLYQVAINLVANACDAVEGSGRLRVATSQDGEWVVLSIADDGIGIPDEDRARIFEPSFTTKPEDRGTGLGLAICRTIVRDHGGTIEVATQLGRGTKFEVRLPSCPSA